jgi:hypothetical protein
MQLKISTIDGDVGTYKITPAIEVAFEKQMKGGFSKIFRENERSEDLYWLAWECLRRAGKTVPVFGDKFLETLEAVELVDDDPNG